MMYDYLIVGSGLYGAVFAHEAKAHRKLFWLLIKDLILGETYTLRISKE